MLLWPFTSRDSFNTTTAKPSCNQPRQCPWLDLGPFLDARFAREAPPMANYDIKLSHSLLLLYTAPQYQASIICMR